MKTNKQETKSREFHIWNFPDNIYVLIEENIRNEFFCQMYKKFSSQKNYAKFLKKDRNDIQGYHYARGWDKGRMYVKFTPLLILKKSLKFINKRLKDKIEKNVLEIKTHNGKSITNPKLPVKENPTLYQIIAHIIGDGNDSHTPYYANTCKKLREEFKRDLQIFGKVFTFESISNTTPCVNFSKTITNILKYIFDIKFTYPNKVPSLIFTASKECKSAFLRALFDDEGTITANLSICMHNENILNQTKKLLNSFGIQTGIISKTNYKTKKGERIRMSFNILKRSYTRFQKEINFSHPDKRKKLELTIATQNRIQRTRDPMLIEDKILQILEYKPSNTMELANQLLFTINGILPHLNNLEKEGMIIDRGYKNKKIWDLA